MAQKEIALTSYIVTNQTHPFGMTHKDCSGTFIFCFDIKHAGWRTRNGLTQFVIVCRCLGSVSEAGLSCNIAKNALK